MLNDRLALGLMSAAAFGAVTLTPASAAAPMGVVGSVSGAYGSSDWSNGGGDTDTWGLNGAAAFGFGTMNMAGEISGGYQNSSNSGPDLDAWYMQGSAFWAPMMGRFGGTVNYTSVDAGVGDADFVTYGAFGEYYGGDQVTLAGRVGGWHVNIDPGSFSDSGAYLGGALTGYFLPNFAIQGAIDHINGVDLGFGSSTNYTNFSLTGEFQLSEMTPISIFGGYTYNDVSCSGCGHGNTWSIGLKFYTGPGTLIDHHRNGTLNWVANALGFNFSF